MLNKNIDQSAITSPSSPSVRFKPFFGLRFLIIVSVILLIVVIFIIGSPQKANKSQLQIEADGLSSQLAASSSNQSFVAVYKRALEEVPKKGNEKAQYKAIFNLVQGISGEYANSHNPALRQLIEEIGVFAQKNYATDYKKMDFFVLCSDEKCGKLSYDPAILEIKQITEKSDVGPNKTAILGSLYDASITSAGTSDADKNRVTDNLTFALRLFHQEAVKGNVVAKDLETKLLTYLKKSVPSFVIPWEATASVKWEPFVKQK